MTSKVCRYFFTYLALVTLLVLSHTALSAQTRRITGKPPVMLAGQGQSLETDKSVYKFNESAAISGKNFTPLGRTRITIEPVGIYVAASAPVALWDVYADASGRFSTSWPVAYPGTIFKVSASDLTASVETSTEFILLTGGASLEQCRNGTLDAPIPCSGSAWANGNLNGSQAHFLEGSSVPYRMVFTGLAPGTQYTVTIEWDTTVSKSTHALDYLTTYNRTETTADPCTGVGACNPAVYVTAPIPLDQNVAAGEDQILGTADDITQIPGVFTYWGGTIDAVSTYTMTGTFAGASTNSVTVTFTPNAADSVLAWGGHISTRADWGFANSAVAISGSPFHMRLGNFNGSPGNQDRAIQSDAVIFPAKVIVVVDVRPHSGDPFTFSMTGLDMTTMSLDDNGVETDTYQSVHTFSDIVLFGSGYPVKVVEDTPPGFYSLSDLSCVSDPAPGIGSGTISTSLIDRQALLTLAEGETVTCTFVNLAPTSARVAVSGSVTDARGRALTNVVVTAVSTLTGEVLFAKTNIFGRYTLPNLEVGVDYVVQPRSSRYRFEPGVTVLNVMGDETGVNFTAAPTP